MQADYIIIGQGICGTFLSYYLKKAGAKVLVIDAVYPGAASKIASGVINPVTGRRVVSTWMIDELLSFAHKAYSEIGYAIGAEILQQKNMIVFPPSVQMFQAHCKRIEEKNSFVKEYKDENLRHFFYYPFESFEISPVYLIYLHYLIDAWKNILEKENSFLKEFFDEQELKVHEDSISYKSIKAKKIIFCNGTAAFVSAFWKKLPYVYNKGEALVAQIDKLPQDKIYKHGAFSFVPWYNQLWWIGSSYENNFETTAPTEQFRQAAITSLKQVLKIPFEIKAHLAAVRPAVIERRPFVGFHPNYKAVAILNGMGTKGCSLAPYFAKELCEAILSNTVINPLADVQRFKKILQ